MILKNISIRKKMMFFIMGITIFIYILTLGYMGISLKNNAITEARKLLDSEVLAKANEIKSRLDETMAVSRTMATSMKTILDLPIEEMNKRKEELLTSILKDYPKYPASWVSLELSAIDPTWDKPFGRERTIYFKKNGMINKNLAIVNTEGDDLNGTYYANKISPGEVIAEPYLFDGWDGKRDELILCTSSDMPILDKNGKFIGLIGVDLTFEDYSTMTNFDSFDQGYAILIANNGAIVAHPENGQINKKIDSLSFSLNNDFNITEIIQNGVSTSFISFDDYFDEEVYVSVASLQIGRSKKPWGVCIVVPVAEITADFNRTLIITIFVGLLGLFCLSTIIWWISQSITNSIENTNGLLKRLAKGHLDSEIKLQVDGTDELNQMGNSVNVLIEELTKKAKFSREIGAGNLDADFEIASEEDSLGVSLLKMRNNLKEVIEDTKRVLNSAGHEGLLNERIIIEDQEGAWKELSFSINALLASFGHPLQTLNSIINSMAEGDLTGRYVDEAKGDIKVMSDSLNKALENISHLFNQIAQHAITVDESTGLMIVSSEEMSSSTDEIASAIAEMSSGAQNQVSKVDKSSMLIEEMRSSAETMHQKAENINHAAQTGTNNAEKGMNMMNEVVSGINHISTFSEKTDESIKVLMERSNEIARVLSVITDIAAQTNLLALNAAIEAAQAGDSGRGFAVVAEEIRKLAEDSKNSAKEIETLIDDVQTDTDAAARNIEDMNSRVKSSENTSKVALEVFKELRSSTDETLSYSEEILNGAQNQINNINDVISITESIVVIAEETAAGTEEVASSASELSAGMTNYNSKTRKLAQVAKSLAEGVGKIKISS